MGNNFPGQYCLSGSVVNVPVDVNNMVNILPRSDDALETVYVKLSKRLKDKSSVMFETIRPHKVFEAAKYLSEQELYIKHKIKLELNWKKSHNSQEHDVVESVDDLTPQHNDETQDHDEESENEERVGNVDTLICENENDDMVMSGIKFAPGEGKKPIGVLFDEDCEQLSFPTIYAGKIRKFKHKVVSYAGICKSELRRFDRRACKVSKLFFMYKKLQIERVIFIQRIFQFVLFT